MNVYLSDKFESQINKTTEIFGFQQAEVVERALLYYFDSFKDKIMLKAEFDELDNLSDEALRTFEERIEKR